MWISFKNILIKKINWEAITSKTWFYKAKNKRDFMIFYKLSYIIIKILLCHRSKMISCIRLIIIQHKFKLYELI